MKKSGVFVLAITFYIIFVSGSSFGNSDSMTKWISGTPIIEEIRGTVEQRILSKEELQSLGRLDLQGNLKSFEEGDTHTFITHNFVTNEDENTPATLRKKGNHCYIWVADDQIVSDTVLTNIATEFDSNIYPTLRTYFGKEPDIDSDPLIHILIFDIQDGYTGIPPNDVYIAGYFDPGDQGGRNNMDMFYMDCNPGIPGSTEFYGTLAHEFQHMIHYNMDRNM